MQNQRGKRPILVEILVILGNCVLLSCIFLPMFWRLDKDTEMSLRTVGMLTSFAFMLAFTGWFLQWLFDLKRRVATLLTVAIGTLLIWAVHAL